MQNYEENKQITYLSKQKTSSTYRFISKINHRRQPKKLKLHHRNFKDTTPQALSIAACEVTSLEPAALINPSACLKQHQNCKTLCIFHTFNKTALKDLGHN